MSLPQLAFNAEIARCTRCDLKGAMKGLGVGNPKASILLVAQNPGNPTPRNMTLVPFDFHLWSDGKEWRSGGMLHEMLKSVGIPDDAIYITNVMKCQGKPVEQCVDNCADWLEQELLLLEKLRLIVALGDVAGRRLGCRQSYTLTRYQSRILRQSWIVAKCHHPAAPLYPDGISQNEYLAQWRFVAAVWRRVERDV